MKEKLKWITWLVLWMLCFLCSYCCPVRLLFDAGLQSLETYGLDGQRNWNCVGTPWLKQSSIWMLFWLSVVKMCVSHTPFISRLSQHSTLFSAIIIVSLFIPVGISRFKHIKPPHPRYSLLSLTALQKCCTAYCFYNTIQNIICICKGKNDSVPLVLA